MDAIDLWLSKADVAVEEVFDECDDCTHAIEAAYTVAIDFRSAGVTQQLGHYCKPCAEDIAERIRNGLSR